MTGIIIIIICHYSKFENVNPKEMMFSHKQNIIMHLEPNRNVE